MKEWSRGCKSKTIKHIWRKDTTWAVIRGTEEVRDPQTWDWLKRGALKKDTEDILTAAQDQAPPTNYIRNMIELTSKMFHRCVAYVVEGRKLSAL